MPQFAEMVDVSEERRHLVRFLVVGVLCVGIDLGCYAGLVVLGFAVPVAKGVGYIAGMILGFVLNKTWTFGSRRSASGEAVAYILLYALTFAVNIAVNSGVLATARVLLPGTWPAIAAFLAATGLTTALNFLGMRFVAFRKGIAERRVARE